MIGLHLRSPVTARPALVAALSCSLAGTQPLAAQATTNAHCPGISAVLSRLDELFGAGDVDGYLAAFQPDSPQAHAARQRRLQCLLGADPRPRLVSSLAGEPRQIGDRTVVRVRHDLRRATGTAPDTTTHEWREDTMLALRKAADGSFVATFEVTIPADVHCLRDDKFRCPPCNYEIGGAPGWLCVPLEREAGHSLETVAFWRIGTDVVCEIAVQVDTDRPPAKTVAHRLADTLLGAASPGSSHVVEAWTPPAHAGDAPRNCDGARVEIELPAPPGKQLLVLHVMTLGPLQHVLLARGSEKAMLASAAALQQLLRTYRLLDLDPEHALTAYKVFLHHTGGALEDGVYRNPVHHVECRGPAGWTGKQRCGGTAFHVHWESPRGSKLDLMAFRRPVGITKWSPASAIAWLRYLTATVAATLPSDPAAFVWKEDGACGGVSCCVACTSSAGKSTSSARALHIVVRDDLLIVLDARTNDAADQTAVIDAMRSLRRAH